MLNINEPKQINELDLSRDLPINNSILVDDMKTLNLVREVLVARGTSARVGYEVPESFDNISQGTFAQMQEIDKTHQKNLISRDVAIELIADLFESDGLKQRFEKYANDLLIQKLRKLYELLEIAYQDLLHALNIGHITQQEFMERYSKLRDLESNSIQEILTTDEILHKHSR